MKYLISILGLLLVCFTGVVFAVDPRPCEGSLANFVSGHYEDSWSVDFFCDLGEGKTVINNGAIFAFNENLDAVPLVISVSHPLFEVGTWQQGVYAFDELIM